ncbi:MAG: DUF2232 domain-containing protein [Gemmatimonadaceae bacterium]
MSSVTAPGWRSALLALVVFLVLPLLPTALKTVIPVAQTWILFTAALAVCAALGWWNGGRIMAAAAAVLVAVAAALTPLWLAGTAYGGLVYGWTLLVCAAFGVASLLTPREGFFVRALSAVGMAVVGSFVMASITPGGTSNVRAVMLSEYGRRTDSTIGWFNHVTASPDWRKAAEKNPQLDAMAVSNEVDLRRLPDQAARLLPALVVLESLAALALAWVVYNRLSRTAAGPELGSLRDFRFNDQLIWGLAVGATIFFLPVFQDGKSAGLNLLVFFGALYLLRGVGVLSCVTRGKWVGTLLIILTIFAPTLLGALALGVGVGDTWMDWRTRAQSPT